MSSLGIITSTPYSSSKIKTCLIRSTLSRRASIYLGPLKIFIFINTFKDLYFRKAIFRWKLYLTKASAFYCFIIESWSSTKIWLQVSFLSSYLIKFAIVLFFLSSFFYVWLHRCSSSNFFFFFYCYLS